MTDYLAVAELPSEDGVSEHTVMNTFAFRDLTNEPTALVSLADAVGDFYAGLAAGQTNKVGYYISKTQERATDGCSVKIYDITGKLDGSPHGSPVHEGTFTLPAGVEDSLAPQLACALTLRARNWESVSIESPGGVGEPPTIRPRQRRTGRIYIGPLATAVGYASEGTGFDRPNGTFQTDLTAAAEQLQDELASDGIIWCVWSRTAANLAAVVRVEVDDSFDVIRRRKAQATTRSIRTFSPVPSLSLGA